MNSLPKHLDSPLRRSKSLYSLADDSVSLLQGLQKDRSFSGRTRMFSESSEAEGGNDTDSETSVDGKVAMPPVTFEGEVLASLEQKIDRLSDLFLEQCRLLSSMKEEIQDSKDSIEKSSYVHHQLLTEIVNKTINQRVLASQKTFSRLKELSSESDESERDGNTRARSLLDALEVKRACSLDRGIRDSLTAFLQSDELRESIVSSTTASVRDVVRGCVARDVSSVYLPALERSHRRLMRHVSRTLDEAFSELGENSTQLSRQMFRASRNLRRTLERHTNMGASDQSSYVASMRRTVEELLDKELKQWRQKILDVITAELQPEPERPESPPLPEYPPLSPISPPQPADPEMSIIDQLMKSAEINKQIRDGQVNEAFTRALSASDLALVTAACRAADPRALFAPPCALAPPVLLALAQQLATDMVHDTQLKCRYLEDAIISLDRSNPATKTHLPTVVGEIRKHLMKFLLSYPNHVAVRRVTLIVMAADNLLKHCN